MVEMARVYLGLGTNLGDRQGHLDRARRQIDALPGTRVIAASAVHETEPVGPPGQGPYLNMALAVDTDLPPRDLLGHLQAIERDAGRAAPDQRIKWGPRELDIDILLVDEQVIAEPGLKVPHPHLHERMFVLGPLVEIAPEAKHPTLGRTVRELWQSAQG